MNTTGSRGMGTPRCDGLTWHIGRHDDGAGTHAFSENNRWSYLSVGHITVNCIQMGAFNSCYIQSNERYRNHRRSCLRHFETSTQPTEGKLSSEVYLQQKIYTRSLASDAKALKMRAEDQFQPVVSTEAYTLHCEKRSPASWLFQIRHSNVFSCPFILLHIAEGKSSIGKVFDYLARRGSHPCTLCCSVHHCRWSPSTSCCVAISRNIIWTYLFAIQI